jgi:hypothetical protein
MSYYAKGLKDLIRSTQLNLEFYESLNDFQIHFIEMCFKKNNDEQIGMMGEVEEINYNLFNQFKLRKFEKDFGLDEEIWSKAS